MLIEYDYRGGLQLPNQEDTKHDLLLVVVSMLFIIFVLGLGESTDVSIDPIIIPS